MKEAKEVKRGLMQTHEEWTKPEHGQIRLKASSLVEGQVRIGAVGITAMNEEKRIINAWSATREGMYTPVAAELETVRCALILAQQHGWRKIEVRVDVKAIASCLRNGTSPIVESITLAEDIFLLALIFEGCKFGFEHRKYNRTCTRLALFPFEQKATQTWCGLFPNWLFNVVQQDAKSVDLV